MLGHDVVARPFDDELGEELCALEYRRDAAHGLLWQEREVVHVAGASLVGVLLAFFGVLLPGCGLLGLALLEGVEAVLLCLASLLCEAGAVEQLLELVALLVGRLAVGRVVGLREAFLRGEGFVLGFFCGAFLLALLPCGLDAGEFLWRLLVLRHGEDGGGEVDGQLGHHLRGGEALGGHEVAGLAALDGLLYALADLWV